MINEILKGLRIGYTVLFENHWFPGLTLLNRGEAQRLLDGVHYPHKGFVLDIGHLMNTKARIRTEEEAVAYILGRAGRPRGPCARHQGDTFEQRGDGGTRKRIAKKRPVQPRCRL